jgi:hypothetical protein
MSKKTPNPCQKQQEFCDSRFHNIESLLHDLKNTVESQFKVVNEKLFVGNGQKSLLERISLIENAARPPDPSPKLAGLEARMIKVEDKIGTFSKWEDRIARAVLTVAGAVAIALLTGKVAYRAITPDSKPVQEHKEVGRPAPLVLVDHETL